MHAQVYQVRLADSELRFDCAADDTVLRAALRHGLAFPYECNVGSCGNCRFDLLQGQTESNWDQAPGLSERDRLKGRQLGCQSRPLSDLTIKLRTQDKYKALFPPRKCTGRLVQHRALTHDLWEFIIELDQPMAFASGQYALFQLPGVQGVRAYSMSNAGAPTRRLEIQVRRVPQGAGSQVLFALEPGSPLQVDGPFGMAYLREDAERDIVCLAGGSGLAPMLSIARGALASAALAKRRVHFLYGARTQADVCGEDMLAQIPHWADRGRYQAVISSPHAGQPLPDGCLSGFLHDAAETLLGESLGEMEIYFAGPAAMAQAVLKMLVARKINMDRVHFDQFY